MSQETKRRQRRSLILAFWLNAFFAVIEVVGAFYTHSTAILTDSIHDLGDTLAIGLGIIFEKISDKKPTSTFTYGYKRFSLLSAFVLSLFLIGSAGIMVFKAIENILNPHYVNSEGMLWLAILGIAVNGLAFFRIKQSGKGGHDGHAHLSQNSKAIMLHFMEDVLGWVAVLIGSIVIYYTHWFWIDGLLSIGIAAFISVNAVKNLIETMRVFLQAAPKHINTHQLNEDILSIDGVISIKELHVWNLDDDEVVCSVSIVVAREKDWQIIQQEILKMLKEKFIDQSTIQIDLN